MDIKSMVRDRLNRPIYIIDGIEITSTVLGKIAVLVQNVMVNEQITFDESFEQITKSELFEDMKKLDNKLWLTDDNELIDMYYVYNNTKKI